MSLHAGHCVSALPPEGPLPAWGGPAPVES